MNEKEIADAVNSYSKFSTEQLMEELVKQMATQKQKDGGVGMNQVIDRIRPLLNVQQQKRLEEILRNVGHQK